MASTASSRSWTRRLLRKRRRSGARSMSSVLAPSTSAMPSRGSRYLSSGTSQNRLAPQSTHLLTVTVRARASVMDRVRDRARVRARATGSPHYRLGLGLGLGLGLLAHRTTG